MNRKRKFQSFLNDEVKKSKIKIKIYLYHLKDQQYHSKGRNVSIQKLQLNE